MRDSGSTERFLAEALSKIVRNRDAERVRVSRLLHDEVGQVLSAVGLHLDVLRLDLKDKAPEIGGRTAEIQEILEGAVQQVRRLSYQLCPEPVERSGLSVALRQLAGRYRQAFSGELNALCENVPDLPADVATSIYRIAEQAVDNAVRHARCTRIDLTFKTGARGATLEVRDNGKGFDREAERRAPSGLGLLLMEGYACSTGLNLRFGRLRGRDTIVKVRYSRTVHA